MKKVSLGILSLFASSALFAGTYTVDTAHSNAGFTVKHMMVTNVTGKIKDISGTFEYDEKKNTLVKVECVIECDGHDFHEKTKEQVARGKRRDRDLISMGYDVIHFSGSEIWHDVDACSQYICDFIEKKHDRLLEQLRKA